MKWSRIITTVDAHIGCEVSRVITGGVIDVPGGTMQEKLAYLNKEDDSLRRFVLMEPRGGVDKTTNLLVPPTRGDADAGFIPMEANGCYPMSGANAICVTTVLLETGILPMKEPETTVVLDTAAGLVPVRVHCADGRCLSCAVATPRAMAITLDQPLEVEGYGTLQTDIGWGGWFYGFVDAGRLGFAIKPDEAVDIAFLLRRIGAAIAEQLDVKHPYEDSVNEIDLAPFPFLTFERTPDQESYRYANMMPGGRIDRSPCGTGAAAHAAILHARGKLAAGTQYSCHSITGAEFLVRIIDEKTISGVRTVQPEITGRAFIYGTSQLGVNPEDPYPLGTCLPDIWGSAYDANVRHADKAGVRTS
jgi:proline racemase